jgi:hypothetical protein
LGNTGLLVNQYPTSVGESVQFKLTEVPDGLQAALNDAGVGGIANALNVVLTSGLYPPHAFTACTQTS